MCAILIINNIIFCTTVYAAAAGSTVGITALPATTQNEFYSILETLLKSLFDTSSSRTITVTGEDGKQYTYDFNSAFDIIQAKIDGNYDIANAELGAQYPEVPDDVTFSIDASFLNSLPAGIKLILTPVLNHTIALWDKSTVHSSSTGGSHGGAGRRRLSASDYSSAVNDILNDIYSKNGSSITLDMKHVNGVPQNELVISSPLTIPCFDYLGLNYGCTTNFNDPIIDIIRDPLTNRYDSRYSYYSFFVITSDKTLYCLTSLFDCYSTSRGVSYSAFNTNGSGYLLSNYFFGGTAAFMDDWQYRMAFRFFENNGKLYPSIYISYNFGGDFNNLIRYQTTFGNPALSAVSNLFSDENFKHVSPPINYFENLDYSNYNATLDTFFYSPLNNEYINSEELLKKDISVVGYFGSNSNSSDVKYNSSNISNAGNLLPTYDTLYTGGSSSTISALSDLQKAIYILAQQYGESYEELLQKLDMIIDSNGNVTIVGADGIEYKVDALANSFNEIYSKVDDIASSTTELLEYLKSLNIEGLGSHIASLEGTLNNLNERDKEREAVYGDLLGKLDELNNLVGSLNLDDLKSISTDISQIKDLISDGIKVGEIDIDDIQNNIEPSIFIEKFPFSLPFDLYRLITLFVRDPVEPVFKVPIKTEITAFGLNESIDEEITLDLTMFKINGVDIVRVVLNFSITVGFIVMLIKSTTKLFV